MAVKIGSRELLTKNQLTLYGFVLQMFPQHTTMTKQRTAKKKKAAKKLTAIRIEPELWDEASKVAELQGTTATAVLAQCLRAGLPRLRRLTEEFHDEVNKGPSP